MAYSLILSPKPSIKGDWALWAKQALSPKHLQDPSREPVLVLRAQRELGLQQEAKSWNIRLFRQNIGNPSTNHPKSMFRLSGVHYRV